MTPRQAGIALPTLPKDLTDLQLGPLVLTVDRRLDELDLLDLRELRLRVALQAPAPDRSRASRRQALLMMVRHQLDSRAWTMSWNDRGIRDPVRPSSRDARRGQDLRELPRGDRLRRQASSLLQHGCLEPSGFGVSDVAADVDRAADQAPLDPAAPASLVAAVGGPANRWPAWTIMHSSKAAAMSLASGSNSMNNAVGYSQCGDGSLPCDDVSMV